MKQSKTEKSETLKTFKNKQKINLNQYGQVILIAIITLKMKLMVTEIKPYQSKNIFIKSNITSKK